MSIAIVTDSASDLEQGQIEGITVVPLHLHFGDELFEDGVTLTKSDFWQRLDRVVSEGGVLPTTSQPAPGVFRDIYQQLIDEGAEGIVSVHLSGKLSGTLNSARQGASLLESAPQNRIRRYAVGLDGRRLGLRGRAVRDAGRRRCCRGG